MFAGSLQWFTAFLMPLAPTLLQAQQYTIDDNQIIVDTKQHWEAWEVKAGISSITQDGSISPRFLRKQVNAALDTPGFAVQLQGVVAAGSNEEDAHLLIDGDPQTYWGPDLAEPEQAWWVQIKLGRLVERAIIQPDVSFEVVFGVSDSTWSLYELEHGRRAIGYYPEGVASFLRCPFQGCYGRGLLEIPVPESIPSL